jgi:hypothetical protein
LLSAFVGAGVILYAFWIANFDDRQWLGVLLASLSREEGDRPPLPKLLSPLCHPGRGLLLTKEASIGLSAL